MKLTIEQLKKLLREEHTHVHRDKRKKQLIDSLLAAHEVLARGRRESMTIIEQFAEAWSVVKKNAARHETASGDEIGFYLDDETEQFRDQLLELFAEQQQHIDDLLGELGMSHDYMLSVK